MRLIWLCLSLLLASCSAAPLVYSPQDVASRGEAIFLIKQLMFEQPYDRRPEDVVVTSNFIAYSEGAIQTNEVIGKELGTRAVINRIYFNNIGKTQVTKKGAWYAVELQDKSGNMIDNYDTRELHKAQEFMDAIHYFMQQN